MTVKNIEENKELWKKAIDAFRSSDRSGALYLFKLLAKQGDTDAYCEIGNVYELGGNDTEIDYEKALYWYKKSLDDGNDPLGAYCLGRLYYQGKYNTPDYSKALWYFELAAINGVPLAELMLGRMYDLGLGMNRDVVKARQYYENAANEGYVYAIKNLGALEISEGHKIKGAIIYLKGIWAHLRLYLKNKHDPKLRSS